MNTDKFDDLKEGIASMSPSATILGEIEIDNSADRPDPIVNLTNMPLLPLRNVVAFENAALPMPIGRESTYNVCTEALANNECVMVVAQKDPEESDVQKAEFYDYGVIARVVKVITLPDGTPTVFLATDDRAKLLKVYKGGEYLRCVVEPSPLSLMASSREEVSALVSTVVDKFKEFIEMLGEDETRQVRFTLDQLDTPMKQVSFICSNAPVELEVKQSFLNEQRFDNRLRKVLYHLDQACQLMKMKVDISRQTHAYLTQQQKEQFLQQQLRTIQDELNGVGAGDDYEDVKELRDRASNKVLSEKQMEHFEKELKKLERLNPSNPEYSVQYGYLDTFLSLPWGEYSDSVVNLTKAERVLNKEHYGLKKVKDRILEHLSVIKLRGDLKAPILCLYGPPGVGKTSLGKSVAHALDREYARISLGGLHDEAEIRGHRRTYIGAMPGRIIAALQKCGTGNPVVVLDEVDKIGKDFKGDPSTALLEVLDPEQNSEFHDNFIDLEYDLSKILFIATANDLSTISAPLRDRMEIINISGYITAEKVEIAKRHLIPKQIENCGLKPDSVSFTKAAIIYVIEHYTRESGVRQLEKAFGKLLRKIARLEASGKEYPSVITPELVTVYLGKEEVDPEEYENNDTPGVVTGLAWTSVGGEILFVESTLSEGKGNLTMTGNLGDVMKESATLALQYLKSNAERYGLDPKRFATTDVHIHVPEGAIPKDGPSAGITMVTSLASSFTGRKVRNRVAMTGEITLRGKVLPVGGVKEKILAAKRSGITDIVLSSKNRKDIEEIDEKYIKGLEFHYVDHIHEVLDFALLDQ